MILQQIYSGNNYQMSSESFKFHRRYYKKTCWSLFLRTQCIIILRMLLSRCLFS